MATASSDAAVTGALRTLAGPLVPIAAVACLLAAVVSLVAGFSVGVQASERLSTEAREELEALDVDAEEAGINARDEGVMLAWFAAGFVGAALSLGLAALLLSERHPLSSPS